MGSPFPMCEALGVEIEESVILAIAKKAIAHPRSVVRRFAGLAVRGDVGRRIDAAIAEWRDAQAKAAAQ